MSWTIYPKGCTKCSGDLTPEKDVYGTYIKCMQCGKITNDTIEFPVEVAARSDKKVLIAA
ncbi:MAG: hypothetical protein O2913_08460 [Chloroflexi bacterium]|nr:hypothetical protein [Chloroflexota bacterium]